jgi:NADP-dependent 3-hydroxy acid dehydrogenase YdfG
MTLPGIAWITGGATGIGFAAARQLAASGWRVVLSGRRAALLHEAVERIGSAAGLSPVDVTLEPDVNRSVDDIVRTYGRIDLLVNAAGTNVANRSWSEMTADGWREVARINLDGTLFCMRAVLPVMKQQGSGTIINVSSWAGKYPSKLTGPAYSASKHAVVALTHSFNVEQFRFGLRACVLCPGEVATEILKSRATPPSGEELARMLQPEDLGRIIEFIATMPPHVCINEILVSPKWNRSFL